MTWPRRPGVAGDRPGALVANIMHFARILRGAGLAIGTGQIIDALRAVERIDLAERDQFYWALHAVLVTDHRQHIPFDQAFRRFFRPPAGVDEILASLLPEVHRPGQTPPPASRRVSDAMRGHPPEQRGRARPDRAEHEIRFDAVMTYSAEEVLRSRDFAQMSADELGHARAVIARMKLTVAEVPTRRFRPDSRGRRVDLRATLRAGLRTGESSIPLRWRSPRTRPPPLVVLCDISGSMERYSQMLLCFLHTLTTARERVHSFVFGTRLTNITRYLRWRDIDVAVRRVGRAVTDWSGGTRIGPCLDQFNREWSRRVLGQGAIVLLISDGLDRAGGAELGPAMERLHKSCRRLIWLNPLLRYDAFQPSARGIRTMLPHVDEFRPVHNLASLDQLAAALGKPPAKG
ncbi:MAG: VWA domain-containing protein [Proteobacteria bacterium]|nr:VWA domain-containing protein [Pseudomonadota bacterium]